MADFSAVTTGLTFPQEAVHIIKHVLAPMMGILVGLCQYIGFGFILYGMMRLHRHTGGNMMHRVSPWGTGMAFAAGTVLAAFAPELSVLSNSIWGVNHVWMHQCPAGSVSGHERIYYCPILGYAKEVTNVAPGADATEQAIKVLGFAVLFLFGAISFVRGFTQLVFLGEGGQQGGLTKAVTHIFAGTVGVNAEHVYNFFRGVLNAG